ncbi:alpha/beta hydrolase [Romboutsia weinsteinii]|uniref:Alpha/beta hydrolase n=1 Tax=Romboutsia weinsteinii TaxID=2020949 RepID=A0A371IYU6_9FIRM|nr:alpha/beta hydrolase [Romboutsia weinsteinii]RDY25640.1 alpha/beta hydrolase [Romboutsia weinsteinii]
MTQLFINNENLKVRVCEWGSKKNPTIICIHGLGSTNLSFLELGELLSDKYHVLSIDLPGHGMTPAFENDEDYAIPNLIQWVSDVINLFVKDSFYLMAHSWGGCIALHFSVQYPERIQKILLLDGGYHIKQYQYDYFTKVDKSQLSFKPDCSLDEEIKSYETDFDGYVFSNWDEFLAEEENNYLRWSELLEISARDLMKADNDKIRFCTTGGTARGAIKSMYDYPTNKLYRKIKTPILLLVATLPESWMEIRNLQVEEFKKISNSVVKRIPETTHLMHWDKPLVIEAYARSWFK